ncbi:MAG: DUF167 domain-containing protein [Aggregatilineales bacterium]
MTREIKFHITDARHGTAFPVKVITRASRLEVVGVSEGLVKIRLTAAPTDGKANIQLIDFLAEQLDVPKSAIEIVAGANDSKKIISVNGLSNSEVEERLKLTSISADASEE